MLVLSRKKNETIVAVRPGSNGENPDDVITVTVVEVRGDRVRLGFMAGKEWGIFREEVWKALCSKPDKTQPPSTTS